MTPTGAFSISVARKVSPPGTLLEIFSVLTLGDDNLLSLSGLTQLYAQSFKFVLTACYFYRKKRTLFVRYHCWKRRHFNLPRRFFLPI